MSYNKQILKEITNGRYGKKTYTDRVKKKNNNDNDKIFVNKSYPLDNEDTEQLEKNAEIRNHPDLEIEFDVENEQDITTGSDEDSDWNKEDLDTSKTNKKIQENNDTISSTTKQLPVLDNLSPSKKLVSTEKNPKNPVIEKKPYNPRTVGSTRSTNKKVLTGGIPNSHQKINRNVTENKEVPKINRNNSNNKTDDLNENKTDKKPICDIFVEQYLKENIKENQIKSLEHKLIELEDYIIKMADQISQLASNQKNIIDAVNNFSNEMTITKNKISK